MYSLYPTVWLMVKVTEEVRKNIEVRLKESAEFQTQLEKKLMEVEKEKQELQDDKRKAIESKTRFYRDFLEKL